MPYIKRDNTKINISQELRSIRRGQKSKAGADELLYRIADNYLLVPRPRPSLRKGKKKPPAKVIPFIGIGAEIS